MSKTRKIYALNLTYEVSDEEKDRASKIIINLEGLLKQLIICDNHLDLIYNPFKDAQNISPDQIFQARAALRRYRDKVVENFNEFKKQAFKTFVMFQFFASDTQISKLSKSFVSSIGDMEKQVNRFIDLFSNLESKDFAIGISKGVENIKKELAQFKQIVEDRIIQHVQNNILARSWVDSVSNELQQNVEENIPFSVQLVNRRNEELEKKKNNQ